MGRMREELDRLGPDRVAVAERRATVRAGGHLGAAAHMRQRGALARAFHPSLLPGAALLPRPRLCLFSPPPAPDAPSAATVFPCAGGDSARRAAGAADGPRRHH